MTETLKKFAGVSDWIVIDDRHLPRRYLGVKKLPQSTEKRSQIRWGVWIWKRDLTSCRVRCTR